MTEQGVGQLSATYHYRVMGVFLETTVLFLFKIKTQI